MPVKTELVKEELCPSEVKEEHLAANCSDMQLLRAYAGPYPQWGAPTAAACRIVTERLAAVHGWPSALRQQGKPAVGCEERRSVLDSLVRTLLSQNTTDVTSGRAFATLKQRYSSWEAVRLAPLGDVADAIRVGGLAEIKAGRIQAILNTLAEERGECSLEHLRHLPPVAVKQELGRFKGVGKKTVACVLLFALEHADFAVDTHVWEITKAMGWVPANCSRDQAYDHLNELVPDDLKYDLHVLLVRHGKQCPACAKLGSAKQLAAVGSGVECPLAEFKVPKSKLKAASPAGSKQRGKGGGSKRAAPGDVAAAGGGKGASGNQVKEEPVAEEELVAAAESAATKAASKAGGKRRKKAQQS